MFKVKPSTTKLAARRLQKVAVKRALASKAERARFLAAIKATHPTEASERQTARLVERVRAAKAASFLEQYRTVA